MYKKVIERIIGKKTFYDIYSCDNGIETFEETFKFRYKVINPFLKLAKLKDENENAKALLEKLDISEDFEHIIVYDQDGRVNDDCYTYFNDYFKYEQLNTKLSRAVSICRLLDFCYINSCDYKSLTRSDITILTNFISGALGKNFGGNGIEYNLKRTLSDSSINVDFKNIRHFLEAFELYDSEIFESVEVVNEELSNKNITPKRYLTTKRFSKPYLTPPNIKQSEYLKIRNMLIENNSNNTFATFMVRVAVDILYYTGMRVGELLGLTNEDIKRCDKNNLVYGELIIRNRVSDKNFQRSKKLLTWEFATDKKRNNKTFLVYWRKVHIPEWLLTDLTKLISMQRKYFKDNNKIKSYQKSCAATRLDSKEGKAFYVFVNSKGTVLSQQVWNNWLSACFDAADVENDKGRGNSLSHRFRHAFALRMLYISKLPPQIVSALLGHTNVNSINQYNKPPEDLLLEYQTQLTKARLLGESEIDEEIRNILWL